MELLANLLVLGILAGAVQGLVGVGFTMVLGVARIANFAHGALVVLGMYFAYLLYTEWGVSPYVALVPGVVAFGLLGVGIAALFRTRTQKAGETGELLLGLGLLLLVQSGLSLIAGPGPRRLGINSSTVELFGSQIPVTKIVALGLAVLIAVGVHFLIRRTATGRAMRAVSMDREAARIQGIGVRRVQDASVAVSVVIAGIAGIAISPFTVATPFAGASFLLAAFAVVVIGRLGSPVGALLAGLFIGVVQSLAAGYLDSNWAPIVSLGLVLAFLIVRPIRTEAMA